MGVPASAASGVIKSVLKIPDREDQAEAFGGEWTPADTPRGHGRAVRVDPRLNPDLPRLLSALESKI